jgi:hypothetical protein
MYLWKYWRESRTVLIFAAVLLTILAVLVVQAELKMNHAPNLHFRPEDFPQFGAFFVAALYAQSAVLSFVAWLIGGVGTGRNLGEECGSYLLTRPRRRSWFLWHDWAYGMAELAVIIAATNLVVWQLAHYLVARFHDPLHGRIAFHDGGGEYPLSSLMGLIFVCVLVFCGLVFSVTYFSTIVLKHARGVVLGAGLLAGYVALGAVVKHYWPSVELPHLIPQPFQFGSHELHGLSDSFGFSLAAHALVMLLFPVAAQFLLERSDI